MATKTAIFHPTLAPQTDALFPYRATVYGINVDGETTALVQNEPCAYESSSGSSPANFEDESAGNDKVLFPRWIPEIGAKQTLILTLGNWRKRFEIADVIPLGIGQNAPSQTLAIVNHE